MSIFNDAIPYKDKPTRELREFFSGINFSLFDKIFAEFVDKDEPVFIIMFILYAYSADSPWLIIGSDWKEEKEAIAERLQMPEYMRSWCVEMSNATIRTAIVDYIDFQKKPDFKSLQLKQMQYDKITSAIVKQMDTDENGNINMDKLFDANKELDKLKISISKDEEELKKRFDFAYIALEEAALAEKKTTNKLSGSVENSKWITK